MQKYRFAGYPGFLVAAADQVGRPAAAGPAGRSEALRAMANLCAQAVEAEDDAVGGILAKAEEFRDQLRVATRAAELMMADVQAGRLPNRVDVPKTKAGTAGEVGRRGRSFTAMS